MKKLVHLTFFFCFTFAAFSQCDELFISEYVEGYANNKALEIYNPTPNAINLSDYSIARFSNGSSALGDDKIIQLPADMIEAYATYVIVVDLTDVADFDSQFDKPAWNGFNVIDTLYDAVTMLPITDTLGNILIGPQYNDAGSAIFGSEYNEEYDLQCKANAFLCPDYNSNNSMYFNGNDAVALLKGTELASDGSNLIDVIGVIGEDPELTIMQDAWVDENGSWLTKDRTLVRTSDITSGRNDLTQVAAAAGGSFEGLEWSSYRKNSFEFLGIHNSVCNAEATPDRFSCSLGPLSSNSDINVIAFNVYPNPSNTGSISIEADEQIESVEILNLMGQLVKKENLNFNAQNQVSVAELNSGIYLAKVNFGKAQFSIKKFVVE